MLRPMSKQMPPLVRPPFHFMFFFFVQTALHNASASAERPFRGAGADDTKPLSAFAMCWAKLLL
jgi:hypothetical protein